jgi:hypothetical protein
MTSMRNIALLLTVLLLGCHSTPSPQYPVDTVVYGQRQVIVKREPREVIKAPPPSEFTPPEATWDFSTKPSPPDNNVHEEEVRRAQESREMRIFHRPVRNYCTNPYYFSCTPIVNCWYSNGRYYCL